MHVLNRMNTTEPPLRTLSAQELYQVFWAGENSIKDSVLEVFDAIEQPNSEVDACKEFLAVVDQDTDTPIEEQDFVLKLD